MTVADDQEAQQSSPGSHVYAQVQVHIQDCIWTARVSMNGLHTLYGSPGQNESCKSSRCQLSADRFIQCFRNNNESFITCGWCIFPSCEGLTVFHTNLDILKQWKSETFLTIRYMPRSWLFYQWSYARLADNVDTALVKGPPHCRGGAWCKGLPGDKYA